MPDFSGLLDDTVGQAGVRAANDGNFPKVYGEVDSNGIPKGLLLAAVKMTALMIITLMNSAGGKASDLFGELTGIAVLLTLPGYLPVPSPDSF